MRNQATRPPISPPTVPAAAIRPNTCFAVLGSNRSLEISQKPDPSSGPMPDTCRYKMRAARPDADAISSHSAIINPAAMMSAVGTQISGAIRLSRRELKSTSAIEKSAVPITIDGSDAVSKY